MDSRKDGKHRSTGSIWSRLIPTDITGATRFIPGSHLWDYREGPAQEEQAVYAELEVGDAFMMLSGCFLGGSANKTSDEERLVYSTFMTRGYLRQEEIQYLANDWEEVKKLPPCLQERMGYGISRPFLGWVNLESPMDILHPEMDDIRRTSGESHVRHISFHPGSFAYHWTSYDFVLPK